MISYGACDIHAISLFTVTLLTSALDFMGTQLNPTAFVVPIDNNIELGLHFQSNHVENHENT